MHYSNVPLPEGFPEGNPCSTLYITNIDPKVKEKNLASFFEHYGPIQTVKIVREKTSGKSLSYGFVEFINPSHAELARTKAQYQRIERREILVMFTSERQKLLQEAKVFVKNIPPSVTVNELHNHFAQISPQLFVHINTDDKGKRLNFGFVHYLNFEDAGTAFEKLQDTELRGQKLQLSRWVVKEARQIAQNETRRNLYIRNLPLLKKKVIENSLRQILSVHGEIESMLIKKVPKLNSYYALVSFKDPQAAQNALKELSANPASLEGSTEPLYISWYQRKNERKVQSGQQMNALYMSSLKPDVTEQAVKEAFEQYGKVIKVILTSWQEVDNNVDVKCGYAVFEDENSAEDAFARFPLNVSLKKLFISDPEIELTSYRLSLGNQNKTKTQRRREQSPQYSVVSEEPCMYWPMPVPYMGNFFQGVYPPYFPMGYYPAPMANPAGFAPVYPNPMFMMPQESMMDQNNYLYLPNEPYYEQEYECKPGRKTSMMSTNIGDQETRPNSLGSLSSLDGDQHDESTNTEGHTSSEESDSLELDNKKMSRQESDKSETKTQGESLNKTSCKPKRKYGNFCVQRRPILP